MNAIRRAGRLAAILLALALLGCSPSATRFNTVDITGADYGRDLTLQAHDGSTRRLADYRGKVVMLFFGYTQCPDVCPITLARMAEVVKLLGPDAAKVQGLFVTLDPDRDSVDILRQYVPAFEPTFVGLRGSPQATAEVAKEFKVFYQKSPGKEPGSYSVDHTAFSYVYDPAGRLRLLVRHEVAADKIAEDVRQLIAGR